MAEKKKQDDFWTRKRKEEEREEELNDGQGRADNPELIKKLEELTLRAPIVIDQLEHLYRQYLVGVLARPPVEERSRLDQMMTVMFNMPKPTASDRFRAGSLWSSYLTHKARWDKLVADVESGKIKRVAGPKKNKLG